MEVDTYKEETREAERKTTKKTENVHKKMRKTQKILKNKDMHEEL